MADINVRNVLLIALAVIGGLAVARADCGRGSLSRPSHIATLNIRRFNASATDGPESEVSWMFW